MTRPRWAICARVRRRYSRQCFVQVCQLKYYVQMWIRCTLHLHSSFYTLGTRLVLGTRRHCRMPVEELLQRSVPSSQHNIR